MTHPAPRAQAESGFRPKVILWAVGAALLAAFAFIALATFAPELREDQNAGGNALSRSAVGYAGIARLLRETGVPVVIRRGPPPPGARGGLLILTPRVGSDAAEVRALAKYDGAVLIVAPKWLTFKSPDHRGWVVVRDLLPSVIAAGAVARPEVRDLARDDGAHAVILTPSADPRTALPGLVLPFGKVISLQHRLSSDGVPVLADQNHDAVLLKAGRTFVLTDPDLIDNHGLADPVTARSALRLVDLLRGPGGAVAFDVTLNGLARPRSLMRMALTAPFFAATLCALVAFALLAWRALVRFGPTLRPERAVALGKLALVESAAGLIRLAGRQGAMAPRYAAVARGAAARSLGTPRDWSAQQIDAYLDLLGDPAGGTRPFSDLVDAAQRSGDGDADIVARAHNLFQWQSEMTHERR